MLEESLDIYADNGTPDSINQKAEEVCHSEVRDECGEVMGVTIILDLLDAFRVPPALIVSPLSQLFAKPQQGIHCLDFSGPSAGSSNMYKSF